MQHDSDKRFLTCPLSSAAEPFNCPALFLRQPNNDIICVFVQYYMRCSDAAGLIALKDI